MELRRVLLRSQQRTGLALSEDRLLVRVSTWIVGGCHVSS
jgi:hypothetical protein